MINSALFEYMDKMLYTYTKDELMDIVVLFSDLLIDQSKEIEDLKSGKGDK